MSIYRYFVGLGKMIRSIYTYHVSIDIAHQWTCNGYYVNRMYMVASIFNTSNHK